MAASSGFKQQCPSCEAMVPVRDRGLIGRKIDCPKCKYRFVVEAPEGDEAEQAPAEPAPKSKSSSGITKKAAAKSSAGAAVKARPKAGAKEEETADEAAAEAPLKKKSKISPVLMVGIGLAGVAVLALGVGLYFLLSSGDDKSKNHSGSLAQTNVAAPPAAAPPQAKGPPPPAKKAEKPKPAALPQPVDDPMAVKVEEITNLLPNETKAVVSLQVERIVETEIKSQSTEPGAFNRNGFQHTFGFSIEDVQRIVQASDPDEGWVFSVMRMIRPVLKADLSRQLALQPQTPINGMEWYTVGRPLDGLANLLLKCNQPHDPFCLFIMDGRTLIFADQAQLQKFLEMKCQPELKTRPMIYASGGKLPAPRGRGRGGNPKAGGAAAKAGTPAAPPTPPPAAKPPAGTAPAEPEERVDLSRPYLTVSEELNRVLTPVEKQEKDDHAVLLTAAVDVRTCGEPILRFLASRTELPLPPGALEHLSKQKENVRTIAVCLKAFRRDKAAFSVAVEMVLPSMARRLEAELTDWMKELPELTNGGLLLVQDAVQGARAVTSSKSASGSPTAAPGAPSGPPAPPRGQMRRATGTGDTGAGAGRGGPENQIAITETTKGRDGNWSIYSADADVVFNLDLNMRDAWYKGTLDHIRDHMVLAHSQAQLADTRLRIHELAAALKEYVRAKGSFPRGTMARAADPERLIDWAPDQRLSWLAELLPQLPGGDYAELQADPNKSWTDEPNLTLARMPVAQFLAPPREDQGPPHMVVYPGQTGLFGPTHYVGVAGVGLDAASYKNNDPKRGVFGYDRVTKPDDIKDGPANTIAVLMIPPEGAGPWILGGGSSVRGVPADKKEGVRPFVCAEYKGRKGTFAIMADFTVRFIPADIPADVFQALCTIDGKETIEKLDKIAPVVEAEAPPSVAVAPGANNAANPAANEDLAKMQGTWQVVSVETAGKAEHPKQHPATVVKDNKILMSLNGATPVYEISSLDPSKKPKVLVLTGDKTKVMAIYEISDNEFKLCLASTPNGAVPPADFHTSAKEPAILIVMRKAKP